MNGLEVFGFQALWSPYLFMSLLFIAVLYLWTTGPLRERFKGSTETGWASRSSFLFGLLILYIAWGSPLDLMSHLTFTAHMGSMSLAFLLAPPFLLKGLPDWLVRPAWEWKGMRALKRFMHPLVTLIAFNALFSIYHIPMIHDTVMTQYGLHTLYYGVLLIAALMMWWPVICPLPEAERLSHLKQMGYIFLNGVLLTPACALIIFANTTLYDTFNHAETWARALGYCVPGDPATFLQKFGGPGSFTSMPPLEDQQLGGVVMKLAQEFIYGAFLARLFFQWYAHENKKNQDEEEEALNWKPSVDNA